MIKQNQQKADIMRQLNITTRIKDDDEGNNYQAIYFDSPSHYVDSIIKGVEQKLYLKSNYSGFDPKDGIDIKRISSRWQNLTFRQFAEEIKQGKILEKVVLEVDKLRKEMHEITEIKEFMFKAKTFKKQRKFSEEGSELNIDRVMSGDSEHWEKMTRGHKKNIYRLYVNMFMSGKEDDFQELCAFVYVITEIIESAGYSIEVQMGRIKKNITDKLKESGTITIVKRAEEPLTISKIMPLARMAYVGDCTWLHESNLFEGSTNWGHGSQTNISQQAREFLEFDYIILYGYDFTQQKTMIAQNIVNQLSNE